MTSDIKKTESVDRWLCRLVRRFGVPRLGRAVKSAWRVRNAAMFAAKTDDELMRASRRANRLAAIANTPLPSFPNDIYPVVGVGLWPRFEFIEFNSRRRARGREAARVKVVYSSQPGDEAYLWMSPADIRANLAGMGQNDALERALAAYG